jgi:hypothetical protein
MLGRVVDRWPGARLCIKPRIADVLAIEGSGITDRQFSYALKAHFDFVICRHDSDKLRDMPQFAVELDGAQHRTDPAQIARDKHKNAICEHLGLPLVRARAPSLKRVGDQALLEWLAELWFVYHSVYCGSSTRGGDRDECEDDDSGRPGRFSYARVWQELDDGGDLDRFGIDGPYDPFAALRREFQRFVHGRKVVGVWEAFAGEDEGGVACGVIVLGLGQGRCLVAQGRCSLRHFIPAPLLAETVALDLALVEMVELTRDYTMGRVEALEPSLAQAATRGLRRSPLLHLPALSDQDFYEILLSWLGPEPSEERRQEAWLFAHLERHQDDPEGW